MKSSIKRKEPMTPAYTIHVLLALILLAYTVIDFFLSLQHAHDAAIDITNRDISSWFTNLALAILLLN